MSVSPFRPCIGYPGRQRQGGHDIIGYHRGNKEPHVGQAFPPDFQGVRLESPT